MNRHGRVVSALVAGCLVASIFGSARAADVDLDGLDDALEDTLLARYAPVVYLHPGDDHRPASVEWILPKRTRCSDVMSRSGSPSTRRHSSS